MFCKVQVWFYRFRIGVIEPPWKQYLGTMVTWTKTCNPGVEETTVTRTEHYEYVLVRIY